MSRVRLLPPSQVLCFFPHCLIHIFWMLPQIAAWIFPLPLRLLPRILFILCVLRNLPRPHWQQPKPEWQRLLRVRNRLFQPRRDLSVRHPLNHALHNLTSRKAPPPPPANLPNLPLQSQRHGPTLGKPQLDKHELLVELFNAFHGLEH
jgi:hypothetical protein